MEYLSFIPFSKRGNMENEICRIKRDLVIDGFHGIYYFEFGKDFSHPPERHDWWEMVYVDSGKVNAITSGRARTLSQGEVIFHKPGELHAHVSNKKDPNCMLVISFSTDSEAMRFFQRKIFTLDKTAKTLLTLFIGEARNALGAIPSDYENPKTPDLYVNDSTSVQLLECYLTEFLLILRRRAADDAAAIKNTKDSRELAESSIIELITAYMRENLYTSLTLSDICARFFMGKSQLCMIFSEHVGQSPIDYYHRLKMQEAKRLLLSKNHSITRISDMLGYSSIHNFSRAFKAYVGASPTEYLKKLNH